MRKDYHESLTKELIRRDNFYSQRNKKAEEERKQYGIEPDKEEEEVIEKERMDKDIFTLNLPKMKFKMSKEEEELETKVRQQR